MRIQEIRNDTPVIRGETACFYSFFPYFKVSEKTRARRGPGEVPAARPKITPEIRNSSPSIILINIGKRHMKLSEPK